MAYTMTEDDLKPEKNRCNPPDYVWTRLLSLAPPPPVREGFSSFEYHGNLYVFGGLGCSEGRSNSLWQFDVVSETWRTIECTGTFPSPRNGHTSTVWGHELWVFGGECPPADAAERKINGRVISAELYILRLGGVSLRPDDVLFRWRRFPFNNCERSSYFLPQARRGHSATLLTDLTLPPTEAKSNISTLVDHGDSSVTASNHASLLLFGGLGPDRKCGVELYSNSLQLLRGDSLAWTTVPVLGQLPQPRAYHSSTWVPTLGQLFVFGGLSSAVESVHGQPRLASGLHVMDHRLCGFDGVESVSGVSTLHFEQSQANSIDGQAATHRQRKILAGGVASSAATVAAAAFSTIQSMLSFKLQSEQSCASFHSSVLSSVGGSVNELPRAACSSEVRGVMGRGAEPVQRTSQNEGDLSSNISAASFASLLPPPAAAAAGVGSNTDGGGTEKVGADNHRCCEALSDLYFCCSENSTVRSKLQGHGQRPRFSVFEPAGSSAAPAQFRDRGLRAEGGRARAAEQHSLASPPETIEAASPLHQSDIAVFSPAELWVLDVGAAAARARYQTRRAECGQLRERFGQALDPSDLRCDASAVGMGDTRSSYDGEFREAKVGAGGVLRGRGMGAAVQRWSWTRVKTAGRGPTARHSHSCIWLRITPHKLYLFGGACAPLAGANACGNENSAASVGDASLYVLNTETLVWSSICQSLSSPPRAMAALAPRREQEKESKRNKNEICHRGPGLIFGHAAVAVTECEIIVFGGSRYSAKELGRCEYASPECFKLSVVKRSVSNLISDVRYYISADACSTNVKVDRETFGSGGGSALYAAENKSPECFCAEDEPSLRTDLRLELGSLKSLANSSVNFSFADSVLLTSEKSISSLSAFGASGGSSGLTVEDAVKDAKNIVAVSNAAAAVAAVEVVPADLQLLSAACRRIWERRRRRERRVGVHVGARLQHDWGAAWSLECDTRAEASGRRADGGVVGSGTINEVKYDSEQDGSSRRSQRPEVAEKNHEVAVAGAAAYGFGRRTGGISAANEIYVRYRSLDVPALSPRAHPSPRRVPGLIVDSKIAAATSAAAAAMKLRLIPVSLQHGEPLPPVSSRMHLPHRARRAVVAAVLRCNAGLPVPPPKDRDVFASPALPASPAKYGAFTSFAMESHSKGFTTCQRVENLGTELAALYRAAEIRAAARTTISNLGLSPRLPHPPPVELYQGNTDLQVSSPRFRRFRRFVDGPYEGVEAYPNLMKKDGLEKFMAARAHAKKL